MANDDAILGRGGLLPMEYPYGNYRRNYYRLTTSAVAVYIGQPMDLDTNGQCVPATAGTAGTAYVLGSVVGFAKDSFGKPGLPDSMLRIDAGPYLPAQTNAWVLIADDPDQLFVIQEGTAGTQLTTANIGNTASFNYLRASASSGSTLTGYSFAEFDSISVTASNSGTFQIVGLQTEINSDGSENALGQYAAWKVRIQLHRLGGRIGGSYV